jgi:hypothetical protein
MLAETRSDREPSAITTLDLLILIAGFACGLVLHQSSAFRHGRVYILPSGTGEFRSLLGTAVIGWVWALTCGLAFVIVARRFRFGSHVRPAEWLAVSLAIALLVSYDPGQTNQQESMDGEVVWVDWAGFGSPVLYDLWTARPTETWRSLAPFAFRMNAAALLIGLGGWLLRKRISSGSLTVLLIAVALLAALGPIRLAESASSSVSSFASRPGFRPDPGAVPWTRTGLALYLDARAWFGYSIRALWFAALALLAVRTLSNPVRRRLWTEWAAFACALLIGCCWAYDEFVIRPVFDRLATAILLGTGLLAAGALAGLSIWAVAALRRALGRGDRPGVPSSDAPPSVSRRDTRRLRWMLGCLALVGVLLGVIHIVHTALDELEQKRMAIQQAQFARYRDELSRAAKSKGR